MTDLKPVSPDTQETCGCGHDERDGHSWGYTGDLKSPARCGRPAAFTRKGGCNCGSIKRTYFFCLECKEEMDRYYGDPRRKLQYAVSSIPGYEVHTEQKDAPYVVPHCTKKGLRVVLVVPAENPKSIESWRVVIVLEGADANTPGWINAFYDVDLDEAFAKARVVADASEWVIVGEVR